MEKSAVSQCPEADRSQAKMTPALTFCIGIVLLVLFGWYFATDFGTRKRIIATLLMLLLVVFSIVTIWPPSKKIQLGLDIQGGTSFLIRLVQQQDDRPLTEEQSRSGGRSHPQTRRLFRRRRAGDQPGRFGSNSGPDPGLDPAKIVEARQQLSRVAKLEFRLVYPDNGERLRAIDAGTEVIPPEYRIETLQDCSRRAIRNRLKNASW